MSEFEKFLGDVEFVLEGSKEPFELRNWTAQEQYFELLRTNVLETLNEQSRGTKGRFEDLLSLLERILLRRYLLSCRFDKFLEFTDGNGIIVPSPLKELIDNWSEEGEPYQRQIRLIETILALQPDSDVFKGLKTDIRSRFIDHQPFVNVATTVENSDGSLVREGIKFAVTQEGKVRHPNTLFLSAQKIDKRFKQAAEEIQDAFGLSDESGRYWYRLGVLQELIRNAEIGLEGRSAQAAIGWLAFLIQRQIPFGNSYLLSVWGEYNPHHRRFDPVSGLKAKLEACKADGIRVVALPQATLGKPVESGKTFEEYAEELEISLIPFSSEMPIPDVYEHILGECRKLGIIPAEAKPRAPHSEKIRAIQERLKRLNEKKQDYGRNHKIVAWRQQMEIFEGRLNGLMASSEAVNPQREPERAREIELKIDAYSEEIGRLEEKLQAME